MVLPVEIKSGKDYYRHSAINNVLSCKEYEIPRAFVFCNGNVEQRGVVTYFPVYMLMFLRKSGDADPIICDAAFSDINNLVKS